MQKAAEENSITQGFTNGLNISLMRRRRENKGFKLNNKPFIEYENTRKIQEITQCGVFASISHKN